MKNKNTKIGKCKLCLEPNAVLLGVNHILPRFLYKVTNTFKPGRHVWESRVRKPGESSIGMKRWDTRIGIYEPHFFCNDCEGRMNKYETYMAKVWPLLSSTENIVLAPDNVTRIRNVNVDYVKVKLCIISMFWRSSLSSRTPGLELEPEKAETFRKMIYETDAKKAGEYAVVIGHMENPAKGRDVILPPTSTGVGSAIMLASELYIELYLGELHSVTHLQKVAMFYAMKENGSLIIEMSPADFTKEIYHKFKVEMPPDHLYRMNFPKSFI